MNVAETLIQIRSVAAKQLPVEFAVAACNDSLQACGWQPLSYGEWQKVFAAAAPDATEEQVLRSKQFQPPFAQEHLGWLALFGRSCGLFDQLARAAGETKALPAAKLMTDFLWSIRGIPACLLATSVFRQEEMIRQWARALHVDIDQEMPAQSEQKLSRLDYLKAIKAADLAGENLQKDLDERNRVIAKLKAEALAQRSSYE